MALQSRLGGWRRLGKLGTLLSVDAVREQRLRLLLYTEHT